MARAVPCNNTRRSNTGVKVEGVAKALKGHPAYYVLVVTHGAEDGPALLLFTTRDLAAKMAAHPLAGSPIVRECDVESLAALVDEYGIRDFVLDPEAT